jgi:PKD repeat protein
MFFKAETFNAKGNIVSSNVSWVFGDGFSEKGTNVTHVFKRVGDYEVTVTATTTDGISDEQGMTVKILPSIITLALSGDSKEITIGNGGETSIDLTGFRLIAGSQVFYFPEKTRVLSKKSITLSSEDTKLTELAQQKEIALMYPDAKTKIFAYAAGEVAAEQTPTISPQKFSVTREPFAVTGFGSRQSNQSSVHNLPSPIEENQTEIPKKEPIQTTQPIAPKVLNSAPSVPVAEAIVTSEVENNTSISDSLGAAINLNELNPHPATQVAAPSENSFPINPWILGFLGIVLLGSAPLFLKNFLPKTAPVTLEESPTVNGLDAKDFEIVDDSKG